MNFRSFLASISKSEIWTSWGRSWARFWPRFPTMLGSKTTSERLQKIITKKDANMSPTWTPTWPQEASQNGFMNRRRGGVVVQDSPLDRSYAQQAVLNPILAPCWTIFVPNFCSFWTKLVIIVKLIKLDLGQSGTWWTSAGQRLCPSSCPFWCPSTLHLQG